MKRFLACATLAFTLSGLTGLSWGDEPETAGRVRLTDETSAPPPIPHVIGEDDEAGRTVLNGSGSPLPEMAPVYAETFNAPNIGYQMSGDIFTVQYRIDQRNGGLYGYDDGYTNIGAFIPRAISDSSLLFWDVRGMATNNSDGGFNVGFGRRRYSPSGDRVYSQSLWLDYDGGHWNQYLQVGGSWSMTSRYWRTRVNYNQLISDQDDFVGATVYNPTPLFENNNIVIGRQRTKEVAFNHFDATVGGPIPILGRYGMNWDFGLYTDFSRAGQDGIGFLAHVDANLTEDILADVRYTNDDIWGSSAQLSFVFNLPDGRPSRMMRQPRVHDYMLRPDERNYRVSTKQYLCDDTLPLLCTTTNAPLTVAHIDPFAVDNVLPDGDGSFENPFNSTAAWNALTGAEKAAFDIVLVRPGTTAEGNIHDNNLNSGIVIVENQRLLASTGRFVREVGTNGLDLIRIAPHMVTADVAGYTTGTTFAIPGATAEDTALYGTIFDPLADSRPILTNFTTAASTRPAAVVTIDNSFSVACDSTTEVSGFIIDGNNPNMPTMLNNGIVTGNILDPALGTGVTGFDINSNFIVDTTHGVHITHLGDGTGALHLNRVEGEGFRSNSGLNVYQFNGALALSVEDNLVYNIFGEDLNNDGMLDIVATGTEDVNGNGKLDVGEDLDNDGLIDINEDNDKDGVLGDDDIGIGINLVADSDGAVIFSNDPANRLHIVRNVTHLAETEYFRQQSLDADGNVVNAFTAQDINNDIRLTQTGVISASDTFDNVGNKNGINVEARDGGAFSAFLDSNDTSFNNPYAFSTNVGDNNLLPPNKNPLLTTPPTPLGNEFGLRTAATGVNSVLILGSPNNHLSNNNFGHGYLIEAINNASVTMDSPMTGSFTTDPITGEVTGTTPSEFNDNGLNGMRIYADQNSSLALQIGIPDTLFDPVVSNPDDKTTRSYFTLNQFVRNGADGDATTAGNGIEIVLRSGAGFAAGSNSGIFAAALTDNADNGLLIDVADPGTNIDDFTVLNSVLSGNLANGMYVSAENTPISNLVVAQNSLNNNGLNGINFQMLNSNLNDPMIVDNLIMGNGNLVAVNPISQFNIEVVFLGGLTASQQAIFQSAADRWAEIIVGDLPDVGAIDDVQITAEGLAIDGVNGILGQAGPTALRNGSNLPFQGLMEFDSADLAALEASGQLEDVILHEMGHVLGIGTIWNLQGLLQNPSFGDGVTDTRFTGALATTQYNTIFGVTDTGVPVENSGGPGTADGHWRESILDNELMTGFLNSPGPNPLSRITAGSLQDLGYIVNLNKADFYADPTPLQGGGTSSLDLGRFNNNLGPFQFMNATPTVSNLVQIDPNAMGNGINISVQNSNLNNVIIESNIIDGNTGDGVRLINPQFATNNEGDNQIHWRLNEINNNGAAGGYGINVALNNANHLDAIICQNDISGNNLGGINVELSDNAVYHNGLVPPASLLTPAADEESWFFGNTINGNGGIGYHITAIENSSFTLVGGPSGANTLNNNVDAGIAIEMSNGAQGDVRLDNTTITGTTDGTDPNFAGDGIGIIMGDNTVLNNLRIGDPIVVNPANPGTIRPTNISNNANHGVTIEVSDNASLAAPLIANATISNNGTDGIHVNRTGTAIVGDPLNVLPAGNAPPATSPDAPSPAFVIRDNTITGNGDDGIDVAARLAPINDEYVTMNNNISNNGDNGIELLTQGDAGLLFDVRDSTVNNNGLNGLAHTSILNSGTDTAAFTGTIVGNEFIGNTVDGIIIFGNYGSLNNATGTGVVTRPVQIGSNFTEDLNGNGILDAGEDLDGDGRLDSDANIITDNGVHGIDLSGAGSANITNALIDNNGDSGIFVTNISTVDITDSTISNNGRHGIEITNTIVGPAIDADIDRNIIRDNARDGVQIVSNISGTALNNGVGPSFFLGLPGVGVRMDTNMVLNNGGRGIDTTVQGDGSVSLSIVDITVAGNGENGIYNLVTASTTQDVEALASVDLAQDGVITANAFLDFSLTATAGYDNNLDGVADGVNLIANNNANDTYEGGGVVFRVGTTGALFAPGGGNFSWLDPNSVDPRDLGGLVASLQNTSIVGNNGVDFWTHTFTSTVDPGTTGGTWTDQNENPRNNANDAFNPTNYQQDPLARIEFTTFTNVSGGSADVFGISRNFSTASNQDFAFYNNSEDVFKSRTQGQDNNTDGGIDDDGAFTSGTRPRNGTRTPSRFGYTTYIGGTNIKVAGTKLDPQLQIIQQGRDSDQFLYPGLGDSTMRISAGSDLTLSLFNFVVTDFTNEIGFTQGTNFSGGNFRDVNFLYEAF